MNVADELERISKLTDDWDGDGFVYDDNEINRTCDFLGFIADKEFCLEGRILEFVGECLESEHYKVKRLAALALSTGGERANGILNVWLDSGMDDCGVRSLL